MSKSYKLTEEQEVDNVNDVTVEITETSTKVVQVTSLKRLDKQITQITSQIAYKQDVLASLVADREKVEKEAGKKTLKEKK